MRLPADFPALVVRLGVSLLGGEDVLAGLLQRLVSAPAGDSPGGA